jgi:uncharacterized protein YqeY
MSIKQNIETDLKKAMLAHDKSLVTTLRTLKSAILYAEVASGARGKGLSDDELVTLLQKEAKKRKESADLFRQGGNDQKAAAELEEIRVIANYLPAQLTDEALEVLVDKAVAELEDPGPQSMGKLIARVKELSEGGADGGRIAGVVKQRLRR